MHHTFDAAATIHIIIRQMNQNRSCNNFFFFNPQMPLDHPLVHNPLLDRGSSKAILHNQAGRRIIQTNCPEDFLKIQHENTKIWKFWPKSPSSALPKLSAIKRSTTASCSVTTFGKSYDGGDDKDDVDDDGGDGDDDELEHTVILSVLLMMLTLVNNIHWIWYAAIKKSSIIQGYLPNALNRTLPDSWKLKEYERCPFELRYFSQLEKSFVANLSPWLTRTHLCNNLIMSDAPGRDIAWGDFRKCVELE